MIEDIAGAFANDAAFIPYLAAGDPGAYEAPPGPDESIAATRRYVDALVEGGADIVELGLPFSEPIADGPTIQQASVRALQNGMTPRRFLDFAESLAVDVPLVAMTYYNPVYRFGSSPGVEAFVEAAAAAGISGLIIPDLPVEESDPLVSACARHDLALIFIAAPTTRDDRLAEIMERGSGYLYVQARLGTTGSRVDVSDRTSESLERISEFEEEAGMRPIPKAVGFGISTGDQAADIVAAGAEGIIVGSALVDIVGAADTESVPARLEALARELKAGALRGADRRATGPEP